MSNPKAKEQTGLFAYNAVIYQAFLKRNQHSLLAFYAMAYNWTERKASFHSQEFICRILDMSPGTYQVAKRDLEQLGWISTEKKFLPNNDKVSVFVTVHCGKDDPDRVAKIIADRQKDSAKLRKLTKDVEGDEFIGGRNPFEQKKYEDAIAHFNRKHEWLAKRPKFKKIAFPAVSQSSVIHSNGKKSK